MAFSAIGSSLSGSGADAIQLLLQQYGQEFQQLGKNLQGGNLAAAQADFVSLHRDTPQTAGTQSDFTTIQQDLLDEAAQKTQAAVPAAAATTHVPPPPHGGVSQSAVSQINQLIAQLGLELHSGNLTLAQATYNSLQQDLQSLQDSVGLSTNA